MSETDLVLLYTGRFERAGFTYMITGSVAGVFYGEPRVTHDVDLVLALSRSDTARIAGTSTSSIMRAVSKQTCISPTAILSIDGRFRSAGWSTWMVSPCMWHRPSTSSSENWSSIAKAARKNTFVTSKRDSNVGRFMLGPVCFPKERQVFDFVA